MCTNEAPPGRLELTAWQGARREQLRRRAELPLERIVAAPEEMEEPANRLNPERGEPPRAGRVDP